MPGGANIATQRRVDRLGGWLSRSPMHSALGFALLYVAVQPVLLGIMRMWPHPEPLGFNSMDIWLRFEVAVFIVGLIAGLAWYYKERATWESWRRDWARWLVVALTWDCVLAASDLVAMRTVVWIAAVLGTGALTAPLFAGMTRAGRRLTRTRAAGEFARHLKTRPADGGVQRRRRMFQVAMLVAALDAAFAAAYLIVPSVHSLSFFELFVMWWIGTSVALTLGAFWIFDVKARVP